MRGAVGIIPPLVGSEKLQPCSTAAAVPLSDPIGSGAPWLLCLTTRGLVVMCSARTTTGWGRSEVRRPAMTTGRDADALSAEYARGRREARMGTRDAAWWLTEIENHVSQFTRADMYQLCSYLAAAESRAVEAEEKVAALTALVAQSSTQYREIVKALEGLVDGLDSNCDGRDGITNEQWDRRVAMARAALERSMP